MKKELYFLCLIFSIISFLSCKQQDVNRKPFTGRDLDVKKFLEMKAKWQALNIKNYEFKYRFGDSTKRHYGGKFFNHRIYVGHVVVKNGKGSVKFDENKEYGLYAPDKNDPYQNMFYITSMDDVFDNILQDYLALKKMKDEGKRNYLDASDSCRYDIEYFFPSNICYSLAPFSRAYGPTDISFRIPWDSFKVLD